MSVEPRLVSSQPPRHDGRGIQPAFGGPVWMERAYSGRFLLTGAAIALGCGALLSARPTVGFALALLPLAAVVSPLWGSALVPSVRNHMVAASLVLLLTAVPWTLSDGADAGVTDFHTSLTKVKVVLLGLGVGVALIRGRLAPIRSLTVPLLFAYAVVALVGGALHGDSSSIARSFRYAAVVAATAAIAGRLTRATIARLLVGLATVLSAASLVAAAVGAAPLFHGRLEGYPIPLHPNLLGFVAALGALLTVALWTEEGLPTRVLVGVAPVLASTVVLSGSRSSIAALVVGLVGLRVRDGRSRSGIVAAGLVALAVGVTALQFGTSHKPLSFVSTRGGSTTVTGTLSSRTYEWNAAVQANHTLAEKVLGEGLAAKTLAVYLPSTQYAPVDGTWYAAYLSAGLAGVAILAVFLGSILWFAYRRRDALLLSAALFIATTSPLTDVLNDASIGLIALLALRLATAEASGVRSDRRAW